MVKLTIMEAPMSRSLSLAQAKAQLARCVRQAEDGHSIIITRYGKPVAAVVQAEALRELERFRAAGKASVGGLASLAGRWKDGASFAAELERQVSRRRPPRPVPDLD